MSLPFIFPNDNSSGRLTEICSFRKSGISSSEFDEIFAGITKTVADFPISRQNIVGSQREDPEICVLIADWTSAAEKDVFEPGEQYQSVKPAFGKLVHATSPDFACHHVILPGQTITPDFEEYSISHMRVPARGQDEVASAFGEFASSGVIRPGGFIAVAASREDPNTVVCITGGLGADVDKAPEHIKLKERLDKVVEEGKKYNFSRKLAIEF